MVLSITKLMPVQLSIIPVSDAYRVYKLKETAKVELILMSDDTMGVDHNDTCSIHRYIRAVLFLKSGGRLEEVSTPPSQHF